MLHLLNGLIGILLLTMGRKLFWLFVGCLGFAAGLQMAQIYLGLQPAWVAWVIALGCGLLGALLAVFFQTIAIGVGGFLAGSAITAHLSVVMGVGAVPVISLIGGIIGTVVLFVLFDWALIGLSTVAGSSLIVQVLGWNAQVEIVLFLALIAAGVYFQTALWPKQHPKT